MKAAVLFAIFYCTVAHALEAQSIVAGMYGPSDFYYDFVPDTILSGLGPNPYNADSLYIDANNDGIDDFKLKCYFRDLFQWGQYEFKTIEPLGNNAVAFANNDSCTSPADPNWLTEYPMAKIYTNGEAIPTGEMWNTSGLYIGYTDFDFTVANTQHLCSSQPPPDVEFFLGIKVLTASDTLYGWIRYRNDQSSLHSFTVMDYACNTYTVGLQDLVLPEKQLVKVFDLLGRETSDQPNTCLIYLYSDGSSEKVFRLE